MTITVVSSRPLRLSGAIGLTAVALLLGCGPAEPQHQGQALSQWARAFDIGDTAGFRKHNEAVDACVAMGRPAIPFLVKLLGDNDLGKRAGAATALLRIDPDVGLAEAQPRLQSADPRMAISMAYALVRANVRPELAIPVLARLLKDDDHYLHNQSIKALGELGPPSVTAVSGLAELLRHDEDAEVRWRAAYGLVRIGPGAAAAVPALSEALADPDAKVRGGAAYALGTIGPAAKEAQDALRVALNDADPQVRFRAAKALEKL